MKKLIFILLLSLSNLCSYSQSVIINNDASLANPSAILDVKSNAKGLLIPLMSDL